MARRKQRPRGLGDTIENALTITGVKALVEALDFDCGCEARKDKLNKLFPYRKVECLNEKDYKFLQVWFSIDRSEISILEQRELAKIYFNVFGINLEATSCDSCWRDYISQIRKVFIEHRN